MQSEQRIREYRDALQRTLADLNEHEAESVGAAEAFRLMFSHQCMLTWILDGDDDVEKIVNDTIESAAVLPPA
jgi:hypothetical protein